MKVVFAQQAERDKPGLMSPRNNHAPGQKVAMSVARFTKKTLDRYLACAKIPAPRIPKPVAVEPIAIPPSCFTATTIAAPPATPGEG